MKYTAGQAAKATGVATATITRALKSGKISGKKGENGSWEIDPSELHRVFPPISRKDLETHSSQHNATQTARLERPVEITTLELEIQTLRDALNDVREDRDRWRDMAERLSLTLPSPHTEQPRRWWSWPKK